MEEVVQVIEGIFTAIWQGFASLTPAGVSPEYFWPTFILVFAMVYTILEKVKVFGDIQHGNKRGIYLIVALVFAYFTASSAFATLIIAKMTPQLGMVLVAILVFLIIFTFLSGGDDMTGEKYPKWLLWVMVLIGVAWVFGSTFFEVTGTSFSTGSFALSQADMGIIFALGIFGFVLWFLFKDKN